MRGHKPHRNGKDHVHEIGENIREIGEHIHGAATENYEQIKDRASDYYDQGRQKAMDWENQALQYVREKPLKSMLIAAGIGLVLGRFWSRR